MTVTKKTQIGTIDLTPTWESLVPTFILLIESGNNKGRNAALEELTRMAQIADLYGKEHRK